MWVVEGYYGWEAYRYFTDSETEAKLVAFLWRCKGRSVRILRPAAAEAA